MHNNFMLADILGTLEAAVVFPLFVLVPGFVSGWLLDLFRFRARRLLTQLLISVPLSIAICPTLTFLLGYLGGYLFVWAIYALVWAAFVVIVAKTVEWKKLTAEIKFGKVGLVVVAVWMLIAIASLINLQFGDKLYFSVSAYDHCVRSAFTSAAIRSIPPANPYFAAFGNVPLRYHYFWMMMCALPAKQLGIAPLESMYGGTIWVGIALLSTIVLYLKFFLNESVDIARKAVLGAALLLVTGLDILPTIYFYLAHNRLTADIEWWNDVQVTSWADSLIWAPHYLAALIACLFGFLVLWQAQENDRLWRHAATVAVAGAAFSSATGTGIYVAFVFAIFLVFWIAVCVIRNWINQAMVTMGAGVVALLCTIPYLHCMQSAGSSGKFTQFEVRVFSPLVIYLYQHGFTNLTLVRFASFVALPVNYFLELGFFFVVGCMRLVKLRRDKAAMARSEVACWTMMAASFLVGSFVTSATITTNDLGMRVMLPAQFILLLWAIPLLNDLGRARLIQRFGGGARWVLISTLALGVCGSLFQLLDIRFYPMLMDYGKVDAVDWMATDQKLGQRTLAIREGFDAVQQKLQADALLQSNPLTADRVPVTLYAGRASAGEGDGCGTNFGGDRQKCGPVIAALNHLYNEPAESDGIYIDQVCSAFSIRALVVKDTDRVWQENTWVWSRPAMFANQFVRVLSCGAPPAEPAQH